MGKKFLFLTAILLIALIAISASLYENRYRDSFYPNVFIGREAVGGKNYKEVFERFKKVADAYSSDGFTLQFNGKRGQLEINIPLASQGLSSDTVVEYFTPNGWEKTVLEAYRWGRNGSVFQRISERTALLQPKVFSLAYALHEEAVNSLLGRELKSFFLKPTPAQFILADGKIEIAAEKLGEKPDHEEIILAMREALNNLATSTLVFDAKPAMPSVIASELMPFLEPTRKMARLITGLFSYNGRRWYVSGNTLATWLTLKNPDGRFLGVTPEKLRVFLTNNITPIVDNPVQNGRFEMRNGKLTEIIPGKSGNIVDIAGTEEKMDEVLRRVQDALAASESRSGLASLLTAATFDPKTGIIKIPLEIVPEEARVTQATIDRYNIKDLVGVARTSFAGSSADRINNIRAGVAKLNGILLAPGEEFSAVEAIGVITEEEGFVKEYVIKGDRSVKELGGGLCQLATTLFRLALDAGLPITERKNHRYVVGYYGPGLDATIYGPKPDLRFINDTESYLLLQGKVEESDLVFEFYGQKDGRKAVVSDVTLTDPIPAPDAKYLTSPDIPSGEVRCSETPRAGVTAEANYKIEYLNGDVKEQTFKSVYQPWQKICLIGVKPR